MALMVCPECGKQVSDQAESCPHCGYPIPKYIAEQKKQAELEEKAKKAAEEFTAKKEKAEKKPVSTRIKIIIAVCAVAIISGLIAGYVFAIKQPYDRACASYAAMMKEYERAVTDYFAVADQVTQKNAELDERINALNDVVYSENTPYDMATHEAAVNMIAEAKTVKTELPETPAVRTIDYSVNYTAFEFKDVLAEVDCISNERNTLIAATTQLTIPDYSEILGKLENVQKELEASIQQNQQVNNPSEAFVIERLTGISGITVIEAATEDNDPNGNLHKPGGYTAAVFFIHDQVTDSYVLNNKGDTPVERGTDGGGCIEVYETKEYAETRNAYLAGFDGTVFSSGSHTVCGTIVVRTSDKLTATQQQVLEDDIISALIELR